MNKGAIAKANQQVINSRTRIIEPAGVVATHGNNASHNLDKDPWEGKMTPNP